MSVQKALKRKITNFPPLRSFYALKHFAFVVFSSLVFVLLVGFGLICVLVRSKSFRKKKIDWLEIVLIASYKLVLLNEWNKLDPDIRNLDSHKMFRKKLLNFIRPSEKSIFNIYDPQGSKLLNRLRNGFSHLREHKFRHNFAGTVNPLCSCALETESTDNFFLCCQNYVSFRTALVNELSSINSGIISLRPSALLEVILYGDKMLSDNSNQ